MSIEHHVRAVRTALENTAEGAFTVDDVQVAIADGKQTISLTGAHQDGTAIAYKSLPFVGDSAERAKEIARRIMVAHQVRVDTFTDGASLVRPATTSAPSNEAAKTDIPQTGVTRMAGKPNEHFRGLVGALREQVAGAVKDAQALKARGSQSMVAFKTAATSLHGVYDEVDAATAEINGALLGDGDNGGPKLADDVKNSVASSQASETKLAAGDGTTGL